MSKKFINIFLILLIGLSVAREAVAQNAKDPPIHKLHAFLVGMTQYDNDKFQSVDGSIVDSDGVRYSIKNSIPKLIQALQAVARKGGYLHPDDNGLKTLIINKIVDCVEPCDYSQEQDQGKCIEYVKDGFSRPKPKVYYKPSSKYIRCRLKKYIKKKDENNKYEVGKQDMLLFYFTGHGVRKDGKLQLVTYSKDYGQLYYLDMRDLLNDIKASDARKKIVIIDVYKYSIRLTVAPVGFVN